MVLTYNDMITKNNNNNQQPLMLFIRKGFHNDCYKIVLLLFILILFGPLFVASQLSSSQLPTATSMNVQSPALFMLRQNDQWCQTECSSIQTCNKRFQNNYVDLQIQTSHSILDGPGQHLIYDDTYLGITLSKQSFETQFVMDISKTSLGVSPCKIYVLDILSVGKGFKNVMIVFRIYQVVIDEIYDLTKQIQNRSSLFYNGKVTTATDQLVGLMIPKWDFSIRLSYAIDIIGGNDTRIIDDELVLNQGSERWCKERDFNNQKNKSALSYYCEFEQLFEQDIARALSLSTNSTNGQEKIDVLFVKTSGMDGIIVTCRFIPPIHYHEVPVESSSSMWAQERVDKLVELIHDNESILYNGNVTFRLDPSWGVSQKSKKPRVNSKRLNRSVRPSPKDSYTRCMDTHRCSRGWNQYNQTSSNSRSTMQLFSGGRHKQIPLFADFEDWRQGSQGWGKECHQSCSERKGSESNHNHKHFIKPKGAHWSPFDFRSLGPSVPSFNTSYNNGLVLNAERQSEQLRKQGAWISEIEEYIKWIYNEINTTALEARTRFRKNIQSEIERTLYEYEKMLMKEREKMSILANSQCANVDPCVLVFNTSNLSLTGIINATGAVGHTPDGTEVAIWTFDSIDLGKEVDIVITGQRAMALLSKSSAFIDTKFTIKSGTLGGFPGGFSISRNNRLQSVCSETNGIKSPFNCIGDYPLSDIKPDTNSNNINGPGSGSVQIYSFTIKTSATSVHEVQSITTDSMQGQMIDGGFILHFNGHSTPLIPHNVNAKTLKRIMEDNLNAARLNALDNIDRKAATPGIGKINVSRSHYGSSGGYEWRITFLTAVGNIGDIDSSPLTATNLLNGIGTSISIQTLVNGNSISGTFNLSFLNNQTQNLQHDISAQDMKKAILRDLPQVVSADVIRTAYQGSSCNDGLCKDGPHQAGGYTWSLVVTTQIDNQSPSSPTSRQFDNNTIFTDLIVNNNLLGCLNSQCPNITVRSGHEKYISRKNERLRRPFSMSFGGGGAGYGGTGGDGFGALKRGSVYGDSLLTNLVGGSGGALGFKLPFDTIMVGMPARARGGSGGGALEIVAMNDVSFGTHSIISCNGEKGWDGFDTGGGGGSGGSILISAHGNVKINGLLQARGGDGSSPIRGCHNVTCHNGGGGGGGRVALYGKSIISRRSIDVSGGKCSQIENARLEHCIGESGTIHEERYFSHMISVDESNGAAGTNRSLYLNPTNGDISFWLDPRNKFQEKGPEFIFDQAERPGRVSCFVKFESDSSVDPVQGWGLSIALKETIHDSVDEKTSEALYLSIGAKMQHGFTTVDGTHGINLKMGLVEFFKNTQFGHWYQVDLRLNWKSRVYDIYLDNYLVAEGNKLEIEAIQSFSIFLPLSNVQIWLDEVFVGEDSSMEFKCPSILSNRNIQMDLIDEGRGWKESELGGPSAYSDIKRHESHLSRRQMYNRLDNGGLAPLDGKGHLYFVSDLKSRSEQDIARLLASGSIFELSTLESESSREKTKYFWYREHYNKEVNRTGFITEDHMGGVAACSTTDFKQWKNEGIMLHYANLTDMVAGSLMPLHVERPMVLFNSNTSKYVMWMIIDDTNRSLAMAGVATSEFANGPFTLVRSFYPDGNKTRDQTLHKDEDGVAYIIRTYYATIEYTLPKAIMQPIWESVKNEDGSTNFSLSYHRAHYEPGYDDYHDIDLQRWRGEDKQWQVVCVNKKTQVKREIPYGREGFDLCDNRLEFKKVIGQGSPLYDSTKDGLKSRFLDPNNLDNNIWKPSSVPHVQAQNWKANYDEGSCGEYLIGDDLHRYDPNLLDHSFSDRSNCSNIADNPIHPTFPDKRVGGEEVIQKRRTKFVAVSRLTDDYLDTTGILMSYEGELENGAEISSIISNAKNNLFSGSGNSVQSTYFKQMGQEKYKSTENWNKNLQQYGKTYNDRSLYSLACIIDGLCPVNFNGENPLFKDISEKVIT